MFSSLDNTAIAIVVGNAVRDGSLSYVNHIDADLLREVTPAIAKTSWLSSACRNGHLRVAQWLHQMFSYNSVDIRKVYLDICRWSCQDGLRLHIIQWLTRAFDMRACYTEVSCYAVVGKCNQVNSWLLAAMRQHHWLHSLSQQMRHHPIWVQPLVIAVGGVDQYVMQDVLRRFHY